MAKIDRFTGEVKAFASEAQAGERTIYNSSQESDNINDNLNASYRRGFGNYGPNDVPTRQDFNAMGFTVSQVTAYLYQMGLAEYSAGQTYYQDAFVNMGGTIYVSNVDDNLGIDPITNTQALFVAEAGGIGDALSSNSKIIRSGSYLATYLDENLTNFVTIKYDTIGAQWNEIGRVPVASLGITLTTNYSLARVQTFNNELVAVATTNELHFLDVNSTDGSITVVYSDTGFNTITGGVNPVMAEAVSDTDTNLLSYTVVLGTQIKSFQLDISGGTATQFSTTDISSFASDDQSSMVFMRGTLGNNRYAYLNKTNSTLTILRLFSGSGAIDIHSTIDVEAADFVGNLSFSAVNLENNLVLLGTDPVTGNNILETYRTIAILGTTNPNTPVKTGSTTKLGFSGVTSFRPVDGDFIAICSTNNNEIANWSKDTTITNNWSLYSSSGITFDNTGTGLTSSTVQDAIKEVLQLAYPVGSVWISATTGDNPATVLGFGTWAPVEGRFLAGEDPLDANFTPVGKTAGTSEVSLSRDGWGSATYGGNPTTEGRLITGSGSPEQTETLQSVGEAQNNKTVSVLPPYQVVGMWIRTV